MKANELRIKSPDELAIELESLQKELFNLRIKKKADDAPRSHNFKLVRRKIAQIKTILNEKMREVQGS